MSGTGTEVDYTFNASNRNTNFTYDSMGNVTKDGVCTANPCWSFDYAGQLTAGNGASYLYDALGRRQQKTDTGGTVHSFVMDAAGQPVDEYTPSLARVTGGFFDYEAGKAEFHHPDHLGTPRMSTDYTGAVVRTEGVLMGPFGDNFTETNTSLDFTGFAGGFWDSENTGEHFGAREYHNTHGSWLSPDPAGLAAVDLSNPQTWNRYAYVGNNPVSFIDPLGLSDCPQGKTCTSYSFDGTDFGTNFGSNPVGMIGDVFDILEAVLASQEVPDPSAPWLSVSLCDGSGCEVQEIPQLMTIYPNLGLLNLLVDTGSPANNGTPQQPTKTHCLGQALKQNVISFALDVFGAIPAFGNLVHASVATGRIIDGVVAYGGGAYGVATGLTDEAPYGAASTGLGLGLTLAGTALGEGAKAIPVAGNVLSGLTGLYDAYQGYKTYQQCIAGGEEYACLTTIPPRKRNLSTTQASKLWAYWRPCFFSLLS